MHRYQLVKQTERDNSVALVHRALALTQAFQSTGMLQSAVRANDLARVWPFQVPRKVRYIVRRRRDIISGRARCQLTLHAVTSILTTSVRHGGSGNDTPDRTVRRVPATGAWRLLS
jgi:hypothetical protein